jgi:uncharacterized protein YgiM (DUF1202 family)
MEDLSSQAIGARTTVPAPRPRPERAAPQKPASVPKAAEKPAPPPAAKKPPSASKVAAPKRQSPQTTTSRPQEATTEPSIEAARLARDNAKLREENSTLHARVSKLEEQVRENQNQLSIAETEINRLSSAADAKTRASLGRYNVPAPPVSQPVAPPPPPPAAQPVKAKAPADVPAPQPDTEMEIATITAEKAELRAGPGKNNSAIMSLRKGSRLAVEARQGEWYRVFAPNGQRAWIHASLVAFGDGASNLNDGTSVRVKGYSTNVEEEAFRRLQKIPGGK